MLVASVVVLAGLSTFVLYFTRQITKPLEELTQAAEQLDRGNYDFDLEYDKDDEVGRLTTTFKLLSSHMRSNIEDLNKRVFVDALTSSKNKGAFSNAIEGLQKQLDADDPGLAFAIGVFDCDNLKIINDKYGHEKGDVYLLSACRLICRVFQHSPVFRIGGDEFSVVLQNEDYKNRDTLAQQFSAAMLEHNELAGNEWEQVHVAMGIAVYDAQTDHNVSDVMRRADELMYMNKRIRKTGR
jgi:diguanylate cyclase (GGDEF)-like protein